MAQSASRLAAEHQTPDDAPVMPLGAVKIGNNSGSMTVTLPKRTAENNGFSPGQKMQVAYHPPSNGFLFVPAEDFDGW